MTLGSHLGMLAPAAPIHLVVNHAFRDPARQSLFDASELDPPGRRKVQARARREART